MVALAHNSQHTAALRGHAWCPPHSGQCTILHWSRQYNCCDWHALQYHDILHDAVLMRMLTVGSGVGVEQSSGGSAGEGSLKGTAVVAALAHHLGIHINIRHLLQQSTPTIAAAISGGIEGHGKGEGALHGSSIF